MDSADYPGAVGDLHCALLVISTEAPKCIGSHSAVAWASLPTMFQLVLIFEFLVI